MMRFALLCSDLSAMPVVEALSTHINGHQLTHAVIMTPGADALLHRRTGITFVQHWEDLLVVRDIDAVLVGGSDALILEGAKQLASAGLPILFLPQAAQGSTFIYELSLIRDDNHVPLHPLLWHRFDAAVTHLKTAIDQGRFGKVQYLQLNRLLTRPSANSPIAQADIDAEMLLDTDLLRWLVGDYDQVTGLRTAASDQGVLMQSVVLAGRTLPESNWSIGPVDGIGQWRLTIRGEQGFAEISREQSSRTWRCVIDDQHIEGNEKETANGVLDDFAKTVSHEMDGGHPAHVRPVSSDWSDLVKCFETVDASHRSVRRRRTIELHFEPMSERAIFKTQMTAVGCGLLVATFLLMLCYLGVASFVTPVAPSHTTYEEQVDRDSAKRPIGAPPPLPISHRLLIGLRVLVFAPLVVFLVAQLLLPLTRPPSREKSRTP